jgi:hypothetical protein
LSIRCCFYFYSNILEETRIFYARNVWPAIRGGDSFTDIVYANAMSHDRQFADNRNVDEVAISKIIKAVAVFSICDVKTITRAKRGRSERNYRRWISMKLSQDFSGQNLKQIASQFNLGNYCMTSRTITRLNEE